MVPDLLSYFIHGLKKPAQTVFLFKPSYLRNTAIIQQSVKNNEVSYQRRDEPPPSRETSGKETVRKIGYHIWTRERRTS
jgi:hypothetical protein